MYGMGGMGYRRRRWPGGSVVLAVVAGIVLLSAFGGAFQFFPFFLFLWWVPFLLIPALGSAMRGMGEVVEARSRRPVEKEAKEKELLGALARWGELSPARAALETSLGVAEADGMLSGLAKDGHVEVLVRDGRLAYALWDADRGELEERA
jgi:hypothetical protein